MLGVEDQRYIKKVRLFRVGDIPVEEVEEVLGR